MSNLGMSYQDIINQIDNKVNEAIEKSGQDKTVVYSAYERDEWDNPIDNLDEVPVKGKIKFTTSDKEFESNVFDSPTWLDITVIANAIVNASKDYQNRHLKDIDVFKNENGVMTATLIMGV